MGLSWLGRWRVLLVGSAVLWIVLSLERRVEEEKQQPQAMCAGNAAAWEALTSEQNFTAELTEDVGYSFYFRNPDLSPLVGGPNVTRGLIILPETGVGPEAYAPYARRIALMGFYVAIVMKSTPGRVLEAMMQHPELQYWTLAGHGTGGEEAARIAVTLEPKVKSLVLIAAALPLDVDLRSINLFLSVIYGSNDTVSTPAKVTSAFSRARGDTSVTKFPAFGHYDFAYSTCLGNEILPSNLNSTVLNSTTSEAITSVLLVSVAWSHWFDGTRNAHSYGDNHYLTPGFNDSKPYPGDILVHFDEVPIPGTSPQRVWWVFTPSQIKAGLVYYTGATVAGSAYFPLAFEIAARGHLVVIPEQPSRNGFAYFQDANVIIGSNLTIFSGVPTNRWAIGGHSNGGFGASTYFGCFGKVYGAVLHAGGWQLNTSNSEVPVLQLYGSIDNVGGGGSEHLKKMFINMVNLNKTTFLSIDGANHFQVGDYGYQPVDQIATISLESQHRLFAEQTVRFLDALETRVYGPASADSICERS